MKQKFYPIKIALLLSCTFFFKTTSAQVTGMAFRDYNANGQKDNTASFNENGEGGVTVTAYNAANVKIASYKTSAAGTCAIPSSGVAFNGTSGSNTGFIPSGTAVRIEFSGWKTGDYPAPVGINNKGNVQFALAPAANISFAVNYPDEYSQVDPRLATSVYKKGNSPANEPVVVSVDYHASGGSKNFPNISNEADQSQLGATYGLAYHRLSNTLFASSYQKRHTSFGSTNSTGAIYKIVNPTDNSTSGVSLFLDLNVLYGSNIAGNNPHPNGLTDFTRDDASYGLVGKIGLGDLDISEDGLSLWTINLNDRYLYKIPLGSDPYNPVAPTSSAMISRYPLFNVCDADNDGSADLSTDKDIRPFAIKPYHGKIYIGVICSGESTPTVFSNLTARVFAFDPVALTFTEVLNFPLNYDRGNGNTAAAPFPNGVPAGSGYANANAANWRPWNDIYTSAATFQWSWYDAAYGEGGYSQPIFAGLDFDDTGNMIIGLRDRFGDMIGDGVYDPGGSTLMEGDGNGDLLRAVVNGAGNSWNFIVSEATNGTEFFRDDNYGGLHQETSMGGLTIYHGASHIINTAMDPVSNLSGGFDWTKFTDGRLDRSYEIIRRSSGQAISSHMFAKANALGDVELLSNAAPVEIGNRVWKDTNGNGIQDADEPGIAGVIINLYDNAGTVLLATTTTDVDGNWYFNDNNVPAGLQVYQGYKIRIASTQFNNTGFGVLAGLLLASANVAGNGYADYSDSDGILRGDGSVEISVTTQVSGSNNHNYDFGFFPASLLANEGIVLSGSKKSSSALLTWTCGESTYKDFVVERSGNGISFTEIGTLPYNAGKQFEFIDSKPLQGVNYYRVRASKTGTVKHSNVQMLNFTESGRVSVYPSMATDHLSIEVKDSKSKPLTVYLFNEAGHLVHQKNYKTQSGNSIIPLNGLGNFSNGVYFVIVSDEKDVVLNQKIIINH
jgi:SdrD B-like domain/Secretion system C-terminal sorting domain